MPAVLGHSAVVGSTSSHPLCARECCCSHSHLETSLLSSGATRVSPPPSLQLLLERLHLGGEQRVRLLQRLQPSGRGWVGGAAAGATSRLLAGRAVLGPARAGGWPWPRAVRSASLLSHLRPVLERPTSVFNKEGSERVPAGPAAGRSSRIRENSVNCPPIAKIFGSLRQTAHASQSLLCTGEDKTRREDEKDGDRGETRRPSGRSSNLGNVSSTPG